MSGPEEKGRPVTVLARDMSAVTLVALANQAPILPRATRTAVREELDRRFWLLVTS